MNVTALTAEDFTSDQEVRWCPGCGDYSILKALRSTLAEIGRPPEEVVVISGIGCAARFPYYLSTYGFHTIHGRAPAVATGVKQANPDLDVWVIGGDGDFLAIGGNHLIHALRRDVDLNLLLLNNAIYGLTKGQASPTSPIGTRTPSSPEGSLDQPVNAALLALGAGAGFFARSVDVLQDHLPATLARAQAHRGAALVEVLQNCIVYNDGAFGAISSKNDSADVTVMLCHGEPMIYGAARDRGLVLSEGCFRPLVIGRDCREDEIARHDETDFMRAVALARLAGPDEPRPIGVLYARPGDPARAARPAPRPLDRAGLAEMLAR